MTGGPKAPFKFGQVLIASAKSLGKFGAVKGREKRINSNEISTRLEAIQRSRVSFTRREQPSLRQTDEFIGRSGELSIFRLTNYQKGYLLVTIFQV